jgi:hypothetical protein
VFIEPHSAGLDPGYQESDGDHDESLNGELQIPVIEAGKSEQFQ